MFFLYRCDPSQIINKIELRNVALLYRVIEFLTKSEVGSGGIKVQKSPDVIINDPILRKHVSMNQKSEKEKER